MPQKNETPLAATGRVSCNQLGGWLLENLTLLAHGAQHLIAMYASGPQPTMADGSTACGGYAHGYRQYAEMRE
jgi:hypothetical protein